VARGSLRIYLGAAPGVGKTYAMLNEGRRRRERGADVVVGLVETHNRARTAEQIGDLEVVPRRDVEYRGATFQEMDVDAILARAPRVALIDELAHTNIPGCRHHKRYEDVEELLDAGIDVISTLNIQHLESINDVVERITGIVQRETIPDDVVRAAAQVELVDSTPEALRRRMAHGNIYAPEKIDAALTNYFREGNLAALRELALLWVADQVDTGLEEYRARHHITEPWETRERVVVAITGAPGSDRLIRRAARIAVRTHGELLGVHVRSQHGLAGPPDDGLVRHRLLLEEVGGRYHETAGADVGTALIDFARAENATQIVLGATHRSRWAELTQGSIINRVVRRSGPIDVHVISKEEETVAPALRRPRPRHHTRSPLPPRRRLAGWLIVAVGLPLTTILLAAARGSLALSSVLLLYLLLVVVVAAIGGLAPALTAAIAGSLLVNWYFTPPIHRWTIEEAENVLALGVYLLTAGIVSTLVSVAARRTADAARANAEAEALAAITGEIVEADPLPVLVSHMRSAFALDGVSVLRRTGDDWVVESEDGDAPRTPAAAGTVRPLTGDLVLALSGPPLAGEDRRVLDAFVANLAAALDRRRLRAQAAAATARAEANELRSALLQAVSHDLRTPLASIKASASSLRQPDIEWTKAESDEFLATIEDETDRLTNLVGNLLDMSRVNANAVRPVLRPTSLEEVVPAAVTSLGPRARQVAISVADDVPEVEADPTLLERVVANLVDNALTHAGSCPVRVEAGGVGDRVLLRVVDRGPGIPAADRERVFHPFQRLGDTNDHGSTGVGLGLAVALGFTEAMGGELSIEDTPAGGTTMVVDLAAAAPR
jgi:two-component system sensor histidine kinase KdpD